jgi:hypothetical protein
LDKKDIKVKIEYAGCKSNEYVIKPEQKIDNPGKWCIMQKIQGWFLKDGKWEKIKNDYTGPHTGNGRWIVMGPLDGEYLIREETH